MHLSEALDCVASFPTPENFSHFARDVAPEWIDEALHLKGTATVRRRRLPMEQVPWLVIGMALCRDRPITEVVAKLDLALPSPSSPTVAPSAVVQARARLGESPMGRVHEAGDRGRARRIGVPRRCALAGCVREQWNTEAQDSS
ncbi:MAG: transposase domain-containing protein [Proteobacteria bacterium]|nr:transposase domain-containing protein [Pseudomonadota bacterium]